MNGEKAKLLHRLSVIMAKEPSVLMRVAGAAQYPKLSARHIYQRLKVKAHDPELYRMLKLTYCLHLVGVHSATTSAAMDLLASKLQCTVGQVRVMRERLATKLRK